MHLVEKMKVGDLDVAEQPEALGLLRLGPGLDRKEVQPARRELLLLQALRLQDLTIHINLHKCTI